jgi:ferredoxin-NADP reductase
VAGTTVQRRLTWRLGRITRRVEQTPRVKTLTVAVPGWPSHQAGQHVDVRLTAPDGYHTERSYSIASPPETSDELELAIERLEDGEVSPYLVDVLAVGDQVEFRGPIGGYFIWNVVLNGPLLLVAGGSGIAPIMAMIRHRFARGSHVPTRLLYSSR